MIMDEDDYLEHYGTQRHSGRYPWGSGEEPFQTSDSFLGYVRDLKQQGLSEAQIAEGLGMTTTQLRARKSMAIHEKKASDIAQAERLKNTGMSNAAIGREMKINESSVRSLLQPGQVNKANRLKTTADMLRRQVDEKKYIDIGIGVENQLGLSKDRLATAVAMLEEEGYKKYYTKVEQLGTGMQTSVKVLVPPGVTYSEFYKHRGEIRQINEFSNDSGRTFLGMHEPLSIDSDRIAIRYGKDGGDQADGVMFVRPGVEDVSLGGSRYAQVRVAVDGTHYIKGMAVYKNDLPTGVDIEFNTNKKDTGNKLDALKPQTGDPDNPFGAQIRRQIVVQGRDGKEQVTSAMNILDEEGTWQQWKKNLSSQVLSKQNPKLARGQLDMTFESKMDEFKTINKLTNPAVRKKLLETFATDVDASATHLEAAALPRQSSHVLLPIRSMKETEIFAPRYNNGDRVALIRFPHGGTFEIPELTVNNKQREAKTLIGHDAPDAVGVNHKVAERLSGADFDGDTVLVIPNDRGRLKTSPALEGLKKFNPEEAFPNPEGVKFSGNKQQLMGSVSNLITDMTIRGASTTELARAVRHSMVVIDAEKKDLNYKESARVNGIAALKEKYQGGKRSGASTLISLAESELSVPHRKPRTHADGKGGPVDKETGEKKYEETGITYPHAKTGKDTPKRTITTKLAEEPDARNLSSGTAIERVYALHSNKLKALANSARKEAVNTKPMLQDRSAKAAYANEVSTLNAKLNVALKNRPLERQAQILGNAQVRVKKAANPGMPYEDTKRLKAQALTEARRRTGADKQQIEITDNEWKAIQAGAISNYKLTEILKNSNLDHVKKLATPKTQVLMTTAKKGRAMAMLNAGYTQAEVASALGVSVSTIMKSLE